MGDRAMEYLKQWISPGVILGVVGWIFLLGVASMRLNGLETKVGELQAAIEKSTTANQTATVELVRYQERVSSLGGRISVMEEKMANQEQINVRVFSGLAKLGG